MAWQDNGPVPIPGQQNTQPAQSGGFDLGGALIGLLPGGSLVNKAFKGEQITAGDVGMEALLSAIPFGLGKVAKGAKALIGGSKAVASVGKGVSKAGSKVLGSQSLLTGAQARQAGIMPTKSLTNIYKRTGISSLEDAADVSKSLTGGKNSFLDMLTVESLSGAKGVKLPSLGTKLDELLADNGAQIPDNIRKNLKDQVVRAGATIYGGSKPSLSSLGNAKTAIQKANEFRANSSQIRGAFSASPADTALAKVYDGLADTIEKSVYNTAGVNSSIPMLVKAGSDDMFFMADDLAKAGKTAQANAMRKLAGEILDVKDIKGLRSFKKDFVDINKIDKATSQAEGARGLGTGAFSGRSAIIGALSSAAAPKVGSTMINLGDKLASAGANAATRASSQVPQSLGRSIIGQLPAQAGIRMGADVLGVRGGQPTLEDSLIQAQSTDGMGGIGVQSQFMGDQTNQAQSNPLGVSSQQIASALMQAYAAGDSAAIEQLQGMYTLASKFETAQQTNNNLSQSTKSAMTSSANAINTVNQLEQLFKNAGSGSGRLGGFIQGARADAGLDENAKIYNSLSQASVTQIAKALAGSGSGTVSDMDAKVIIAALPTISDTPAEAKAKFAALKQRLQNASQNTMLYGVGNDITQQGGL